MAGQELMTPRQSFVMYFKKGVKRQYSPQVNVWSTDPAVKRAPELFRPAVGAEQGTVVHTATAAPAEKRAAPRKRAADKKPAEKVAVAGDEYE